MSDHRPEAGSELSVKAELTLAWPSWLGLSAWVACHASLSGGSQVTGHLRLSMSDRGAPVLTPLSGTQRACTRSSRFEADQPIRRDLQPRQLSADFAAHLLKRNSPMRRH
jgi:hypothetical protein